VRRDRVMSAKALASTGSTANGLHCGHRHPWPSPMSRRRFLQGAAGLTVAGAAASSGLLDPLAAHATSPGIGRVVPIPTTVEFFPGVASHVLAPPFLQGPDSDPSTVYNFQGATGLAYITGLVERRNRKTGETRTLPSNFNDMRFMTGRFRAHDGHVEQATFALV
jgi:hypothetical protein